MDQTAQMPAPSLSMPMSSKECRKKTMTFREQLIIILTEKFIIGMLLLGA